MRRGLLVAGAVALVAVAVGAFILRRRRRAAAVADDSAAAAKKGDQLMQEWLGPVNARIVEYKEPGQYLFRVPMDVHAVDVVVVGAGAGGDIMGAGGGAGQVKAQRNVAVPLGGTVVVQVGAGGAGGKGSSSMRSIVNAQAGGWSAFGEVRAEGGSADYSQGKDAGESLLLNPDPATQGAAAVAINSPGGARRMPGASPGAGGGAQGGCGGRTEEEASLDCARPVGSGGNGYVRVAYSSRT
jgi:hypothetical protein